MTPDQITSASVALLRDTLTAMRSPMTSIYLVTLADGQTFRMRFDAVNCAAPIHFDYCAHAVEGWQATPYQTADADHNYRRAARMLARWSAEGEDDCTTVREVHLLDD